MIKALLLSRHGLEISFSDPQCAQKMPVFTLVGFSGLAVETQYFASLERVALAKWMSAFYH